MIESQSILFLDICLQDGVDLRNHHKDCGLLLYDILKQNVDSGASGCGCSASVFCGYIYPLLKKRQINKVLFLATGALMSPISLGQGESIPGIAHAFVIENLEV